MKTMKNLTTGILIGIGIIIIPLILMGTTNSTVNNEVGRYQISTCYNVTYYQILETIIDTKTGEVISREKVKLGKYSK